MDSERMFFLIASFITIALSIFVWVGLMAINRKYKRWEITSLYMTPISLIVTYFLMTIYYGGNAPFHVRAISKSIFLFNLGIYVYIVASLWHRLRKGGK